jgi:putative transposase
VRIALIRAHLIRLNPTPQQVLYFRKAAGMARFVYNWGLAQIKRALHEGRQPEHVFDLKARFNAIKRATFPWVYEVTKCAVEGAFRNLSAALSNFFASKRGERKGKPIGFPKFKRKKRGRGSFYLANDRFTVDGHWLLVRKAALIGIENLNIAGMLKNRHLSAALADASLAELHRQLRYKAEWHGAQVISIDRFFPSSRIHHGCGGYKDDLDLADRVWRCLACGERVDRDLNAARNIRDEACV